MRYLLDTHTFLWYVTADPHLGRVAEGTIADPGNEILLSIASAWEIAIKVAIRKLFLKEPFAVYVPREIARNGFKVLPITLDHTAMVASLPLHHRDPFDRLLIAQAMEANIPILGADLAFDAYPITRLW